MKRNACWGVRNAAATSTSPRPSRGPSSRSSTCTWESGLDARGIYQLFPKHHYLDGGWIVAITDLPVICGECLKMRDYYQMIMNAKRDGAFGPYDIEVKHYGLSAGEMTHALEHIFNLAPEKAKAAYKTADVEFLKDGAFLAP